MDKLSDPRVMRIKQLKGYYLDEEYIKNFHNEWNFARLQVLSCIERYKKLYELSEGFKKYIDSYLEHEDVNMADLLRLKTTKMIADFYEKELGVVLLEPIVIPIQPKKFTIWKESK